MDLLGKTRKIFKLVHLDIRKMNFRYFLLLARRIAKWCWATMPRRIISSIMIIIFVFVPISFLFTRNKAQAAWWNDLWMYRKPIAVTNSSGAALSDFQVKILDNKDLSADITAGKIQADLDDLRFTDINGKILPYWIEDATAASVDVWIKLPTIHTTGTTVYMYYGNSQATAYSDGKNTFLFFDDFNDDDVSNWTAEDSNATWTINSDQISNVNSSDYGSFTSSNVFTDAVVEVSWKHSGGSHWGLNFRGQADAADNGYQWIMRDNNNSRIQKRQNSNQTYLINEVSTGKNLSSDTWFNLSLKFVGTNIRAYIDGTQVLSGDMADSTYTNGKVGFQGWDGTNYFDNFRVRKAVLSDPTAGTPGTEEKSEGPVSYWGFDEGYGTTVQDGTVNNNDGTISGATWKPESECLSGKCLAFDGSDDYVTKTNPQNLPYGSSPRTISYWIYPSNNDPCGNILHYGDGSGGGQEFILTCAKVTGITYLFTDGINSANNISITGSEIPVAGNWNYVAFSFDGSGGWKYYLNGALVKSGSFSVAINTASPNILNIGDRTDVAQENFPGKIDEPKIYNYARTVAQIKNDYNAGLAGMGMAKEGAGVSAGENSPRWMTEGLVGYWKMDESSWGSVLDSSGNGNNGTAQNGATVGTGKFGNGGSFDGSDDNVSVLANNSINNLSSKSVSLWVNPDTVTSTSVYYPISKGTWHFGIDGTYGICGNGKIYIYNGVSTVCSSASISTNQWTNIVFTYTNSLINIYINGSLVGFGTLSVSDDSGTNLYIGRRSDSVWAFDGKIDDVRIYNRALSPQEISDLYNWAPGPIAHWKMDEMTGIKAYDTSGNGNEGTLTGASHLPTWTDGKYGGAVNFDGSDDYVDIGSKSLGLSGSASLFFWIKPDSMSNGSYYTFVSFGGYVSGGFLLQKAGDTNKLRLAWGGTDYYDGPSFSSTDQWAYLGVTINNGVPQNFYINGQPTTAARVSGSSSFSTTDPKDLEIGRRTDTTNQYVDGQIDDVKIYNYARSSKQVVEDMNAGHPAGGSPIASQVGYWKFDEGYGTINDSSGRGSTGTITGAAWSNEGKFGKSLDFDGSDDRVSVSGNGIVKGLSQASISAWVRPEGGHKDGSGTVWVERTSDGGYTRFGIFVYDNGTVRIIGRDTNTGTAYYVNSNSQIPSSQWSYLTGIWNADNDTIKIYINGKLDNTNSTSIGSFTTDNTAGIRIGSFNDGTNNVFNGKIDEVKVYNGVLSEEEIKIDMNQGKSTVFGTTGTDASGNPDSSSAREYCPPGDTTASCAPVAEWKFDEGSSMTANDTSGNGLSGTITGASWVSGKIGKALSFDGSDDYVYGGSNLGISGDANFTMCAWIKWTGASWSSDYPSFMGNNSTGATNQGLSFTVKDGRPAIDFWNNRWRASNALNVNNWYYVCGTKSSGTISTTSKIYVNGTLVSGAVENSDVSPNITNSIPIVGRLDNSRWFQGVIDNARFYNYARTPAQIAWDYNRGAPVGWWKFDEGEGITAYDASGNGNNGTLTSMDPPNDWVSGKINTALDFDGSDDRVAIAENNSYLDATDQVSVSVWVKPNASALKEIVLKGNDGVGGNYELFQNSLNVSWRLNNNATTSTTTTSPLTASNWNHLVATYDKSASSMKIYVNGKLEKSDNYSTSLTTNNNPLHIGSYSDGSYDFGGQIDDVRVYNYSLTTQQVKDLYNGGAINFRN